MTLLANQSQAAVSLDRTRVIYPSEAKSMSLTIRNNNKTLPYRWKRKNVWRCASALALLVQPYVQAGTDTILLNITGEVVSQACSLRPGDETIQVDFGSIVNKALVRDGRTPGKLFQLHLDECDTTIASSVKVTFSGQGASENNTLLALAGNSAAKGIAIGLEQGGKALPLNQASRALTLASGSNVLDFTAYVQLLHSGQTSLTLGAYNAIANFTLDYD